MRHNKLVRDRIPEIIKKNNQNPVTYIASKKEYWAKLKEKLKEEVNEFLKDENDEEFVDVLEVLDAIGNFKKFDKKIILKRKKEKQIMRGGFKKRIILKKTKD